MAKKLISIIDDRDTKNTKVEIKLTDIESLAAIGLNEKEIAYILGISQATFIEYKKKYPEIIESIAEGRTIDKQSLIEKMRKLTEGGNNKFNATKYLLSALHGISETNKLDMTTDGEKINKIEIVVKDSNKD